MSYSEGASESTATGIGGPSGRIFPAEGERYDDHIAEEAWLPGIDEKGEGREWLAVRWENHGDVTLKRRRPISSPSDAPPPPMWRLDRGTALRLAALLTGPLNPAPATPVPTTWWSTWRRRFTAGIQRHAVPWLRVTGAGVAAGLFTAAVGLDPWHAAAFGAAVTLGIVATIGPPTK